jgi:signal transduction histidine kinase
VNELLDIGKMESGEMELETAEVEVKTLVDEAIAQVLSQARVVATRIETDIPAGLPMLRADEDLMRRVLINLLGNAVKFTRQGSLVSISAQTQIAPQGRAMLFAVRDNGEGILPEDQPRIFHKFGQAQNRRAGRRYSTGLGLTFCKLAVEAHAGTIWVESTPGEGSHFFVQIPLS